MPTGLYDLVQHALGDQYALIRELPPGGMSALFLAVERSLDRRVVIKVLPDEAASEDAIARFQREITVMATLRHPHILPLYAGGAREGLLYYVAPFIEGESLRERLRRDWRLPIDTSVQILRDVGDALAAAHARGIVHRDVKPENILLDGDHALLADFGVARLLALASSRDARTATGVSVGTPGYMAPEQIAADASLDPRADIYALAVVGYEMLAGRPPFTGENARAVVAAHLVDDVPSLSALRAEIPPHVATAVMRALAKDPHERTGSVAEFRASLSPNDGPPSRSIAASSRFWAVSAPHLRWVAAAIVLAIVVGAAAHFTYRWPSTASRRPEGVTAASLVAPSGQTVAATRDVRSVAVLPFLNLSSDPENEYFSDGMTEELINTLARFGGLRVPARTSAFAFKGKAVSASEIGRALRVGTLLEGSVRRTGRQLRVTARLIDVASGYELWSDVYDRQLTDVFRVQEDIANAIAAHLQPGSPHDATARPARRETTDPEAHDLYLRGRYFWNQRTESSLLKSVEFFTRALARDPRYAMAYAGLADSYAILGANGLRPTTEVFPKAEAAAAKALTLDSSIASVYATRGLIRWIAWDWPAAGDAFRRSIALDSSYAPVRIWYALYLSGLNRSGDAIREITRARELDPMSLVVNTEVGRVLELAHRDSDAAAAYEGVLEIDSTFAMANALLTSLHYRTHHFTAADADVRRSLGPGTRSTPLDVRAYAQAVRGQRGEALQALNELQRQRATRFVSPYHVAVIYAALGDTTNALAWLERAYTAHTSEMTLVAVDPLLDGLRGSVGFESLLHRLGLR